MFRERPFSIMRRPIIPGKIRLFLSLFTREPEQIDQTIELRSTEQTLTEVIGTWF